MAIRTFTVAGFTTEAVADTSNMANNKYMGLKGASTTQVTKLKSVYVAGLEASTSSPQKLLFAYDSTVVLTPTALTTGESDIADHPATAALGSPVVSFTAQSGTAPQRAKAYITSMAFNAIGGLAYVRFPFGEEPCMVGNAAYSAGTGGGEVSLSGFTGTTAASISASIKYETL